MSMINGNPVGGLVGISTHETSALTTPHEMVKFICISVDFGRIKCIKLCHPQSISGSVLDDQ